MKPRRIFQGVLLTALLTVALWAAGAASARTEVCIDCPPVCPPGFVCAPTESCNDTSTANCATEVAHFTPTADTWTYIFDSNNAIKIGTTIPDNSTCSAGFVLKVDRIRITQDHYAEVRRDNSQFANTVCNPSADPVPVPGGTDCVFYRVHGNTAPGECYDQVDYKVFWNTPYIQGNKHDWMLLRAPCEDPHGVTAPCNDTRLFDEDITTLVDRKPPVGTDPVAGGNADGFSDYIVAISNDHPHKDIPPTQ